MKVWAVANQKGGVGKTTSTVSLAGWLSMRGERTLMIDTDPHGSLSVYFGHDPDAETRSLYQLFRPERPPSAAAVAEVIHPTRFANLQLIPAASAMATLDRQLGAHQGMGLVLTHALEQLASEFDHVLIDCPPLLGVLMVNALAACDHLVVPVQTEYLAIKGLERIIHTLDMIIRSLKRGFHYTAVPTFYDRRTRASHSGLASLQQRHPRHLWPGVIPIDTQFREASSQGLPLPLLAPRARGAIAYAELLDYLLAFRQQQAEVAAS